MRSKLLNGIEWRLRRRRAVIVAATEKFRLRAYGLGYRLAPRGSALWLIGSEIKYGGRIRNVPRRKVSSKDPRPTSVLRSGGMEGGDRMLHHGYAAKYAEYLRPFVGKGDEVVVAEVGILRGTGLATWCDLFPDGKIFGFDVDLSHARENWAWLRARGAFRSAEPTLVEFDQFEDNEQLVKETIGEKRVQICIDDGIHTSEAILRTMSSMEGSLADRFVYFVEDNDCVADAIRSRFPFWEVDSCGELTVVSRGLFSE